mmetsp:Transcript_25640/g.74119  ORF Transcript_25640/g.74119 Transcript_25640/m.74119 type:complete len:389 (-) Transcript_25640:1818-2984(-)
MPSVMPVAVSQEGCLAGSLASSCQGLQVAPEIPVASGTEVHAQRCGRCRRGQLPVAPMPRIAGAKDGATAVCSREEPLLPAAVAHNLELNLLACRNRQDQPVGGGAVEPDEPIHAAPVAPAAHQRVAAREGHSVRLGRDTQRRRLCLAGPAHLRGDGHAYLIEALVAELQDSDILTDLAQELLRVGVRPEALWRHVNPVAVPVGAAAGVPAMDVRLQLGLLRVKLPAVLTLVRSDALHRSHVNLQVGLGLAQQLERPWDCAAGAVVPEEKGRRHFEEQQREDIPLPGLPVPVAEARQAGLHVVLEEAHALGVSQLLVGIHDTVKELDDTTRRGRVLQALDFEGLGKVVTSLFPSLQPDHAVSHRSGGPTGQRLHGPKRCGLKVVRLAQ